MITFGDPEYKGTMTQTFVVNVESRYGVDIDYIGQRLTKDNSLTVKVEETYARQS